MAPVIQRSSERFLSYGLVGMSNHQLFGADPPVLYRKIHGMKA